MKRLHDLLHQQVPVAMWWCISWSSSYGADEEQSQVWRDQVLFITIKSAGGDNDSVFSPFLYSPLLQAKLLSAVSYHARFFYSLFLSTVLLLPGMSFRCRDHASFRPVVTMICPHVPAYTWSGFSHFMCPLLYKPNCFPFSIAKQAWSDSLFVSYVYSLQEWIFTARSCVVSPS